MLVTDRRFGVSTHLFHEHRLTREHLVHIAAHGFEAVELFATRAHFDYHDERDLIRGPVHLKVFVNDREIGSFTHVDGDGMKRWQIDLKKAVNDQVPLTGALRIEVSSDGFPGWATALPSDPMRWR